MRATFLSLALMASLIAGGSASAATRFASAVEDLPLMAGLDETASAPFETAQGRIVRVEAAGSVRADAVRAYYAETLPQLGWRRTGDAETLTFTRAGERLVVRVEPVPGDAVRVSFLITPAETAAAR